ncbi:class I SAM-dependent methyltransferase [Endozoicomonas numazuensis]|uniref:Ribosomal RNA small subunit methyltransferase J n=1 Tax=Endozoicomonas numazuensis TaxID=1137799 RepID=A0A081NM53_9GAMM|nr:class I SAM-dependent methyltransferase [Endozoicomonas numazuensis]KEQ19526.1 16S rRNA methyltransferase [Endozoicomonas numazuensis]
MARSVVVQNHQDPVKQAYLDTLLQAMDGACLISDADSCPEGTLILGFEDERLSLKRVSGKEKPISVDFVGGKAGHRRKYGGGKGQDIAKAVGLNKGAKPRVLDATGGLGRDAFVLASLGCQVTVIERSPVIAALLEDGIRRAMEDPEISEIATRMQLIKNDSRRAMESELASGEQFDVVYLDPMFPHKEKSAEVKKEMKVFQDLLSGDPDADELLAPALQLARFRVVVKRPRLSPELGNVAPTYKLEGKACRYDIHALKAFE